MGCTIGNLCSSDSLRNITQTYSHKGETDRQRKRKNQEGKEKREREGKEKQKW